MKRGLNGHGPPAKRSQQTSLAGLFAPKLDRKGKGKALPPAIIDLATPDDSSDEELEQVPIPRTSALGSADPTTSDPIEDDGGGSLVDGNKTPPLSPAPFVRELPVADLPREKPTPAYHPPPDPSFNHPFPLAPLPPTLQNMKYGESSKIIKNPTLGLDVLYIKRFIDPSCSRQLTKYLLEVNIAADMG